VASSWIFSFSYQDDARSNTHQKVQLTLDKFYWYAFLDLIWEFGAVLSTVGLMALLGFSRQGRSTCRELHQVWERSPAWPTAACHNQLPVDCHTGCRHYIGVPWRQPTVRWKHTELVSTAAQEMKLSYLL